MLLGTLVAWECMRFMALGGEVLELCDGLRLDSHTQGIWSYCFLNQFGEWRYRNNFRYRSAKYPKVICSDGVEEPKVNSIYKNSSASNLPERWLLTNGGGKDTLVGMTLLTNAKLNFDIYEAYLPVGGKSETQKLLLEKLRIKATTPNNQLITVNVEDNFFEMSDEVFHRMGVAVKHFKADFAVGHTANYLGFFPLIIYHGYAGIWFNIEASSDRTMVLWNGEKINHQWCKSEEFQKIASDLFAHLTKMNWFKGFSSTLRGLNDTVIYAIASTQKRLLRETHSCNINKPWCRKCPKCCFSYLMMSATISESFALSVIGG